MKGFNHLPNSMAQQFTNLVKKYYDVNDKHYITLLQKKVLYKVIQADNITTLILMFPRDISRRFHMLSYSAIASPQDTPDKKKGLQIILSRIDDSKDLLFLLELLYNLHCAQETIEVPLTEAFKIIEQYCGYSPTNFDYSKLYYIPGSE